MNKFRLGSRSPRLKDLAAWPMRTMDYGTFDVNTIIHNLSKQTPYMYCVSRNPCEAALRFYTWILILNMHNIQLSNLDTLQHTDLTFDQRALFSYPNTRHGKTTYINTQQIRGRVSKLPHARVKKHCTSTALAKLVQVPLDTKRVVSQLLFTALYV
jgi:hypothetical protein